MTLLKRLRKYCNAKVFFLAYLILILFAYYSTRFDGLVFDFTGWVERFENIGLKGVVNCFGQPVLHQIESLLFFTLYKIFHFNDFGWYIVFCTLHAFTSVLVFFVLKELLISFKVRENVDAIVYLSSFLFLLSPFAADVVVSKVCVHYFSSVCGVLLSIFYYLKYKRKKENKDIVVSIFWYIIALFSLELAYVTPLILLALEVFKFILLKEKINLKPVGIYFIVFIVYMMIHYVVIGSFIGHYGEEVHTRFVPKELVSNFFYYVNNYMFFYDFWSYPYKIKLEHFIRNNWFIFLFFSVSITLFLLLQKKYLNLRILSLYVALIILCLLPILNLYCVTLQPNENDRYSYLAAPFLYLLISYSLYLLNSKIRIVLCVLFILSTLFFLNKNILDRTTSGLYVKNLEESFIYQDAQNIFILLQPDNINGVRSFTTYTDISEFAIYYFYKKKIDFRDKTHLVYETNPYTIKEKVEAHWIDRNTIKVSTHNLGMWFWKYHLGAINLNNDVYETQIHDVNSYTIQFKDTNIIKNSVFLYFNNGKWKSLYIKNEYL